MITLELTPCRPAAQRANTNFTTQRRSVLLYSVITGIQLLENQMTPDVATMVTHGVPLSDSYVALRR